MTSPPTGSRPSNSIQSDPDGRAGEDLDGDRSISHARPSFEAPALLGRPRIGSTVGFHGRRRRAIVPSWSQSARVIAISLAHAHRDAKAQCPPLRSGRPLRGMANLGLIEECGIRPGLRSRRPTRETSPPMPANRARSPAPCRRRSSRRPAIFDVQTKADGPVRGRSRLTDAMLREWPSGDLFGLSQNAGMGWKPSRSRPRPVPDPQHPGGPARAGRVADRAGVSHGPLGGRPAGPGGGRGADGAGRGPVRRDGLRPLRRPDPGHARDDGQPAVPERRGDRLPPADPLAAEAEGRARRRDLRQGLARDDAGPGRLEASAGRARPRRRDPAAARGRGRRQDPVDRRRGTRTAS